MKNSSFLFSLLTLISLFSCAKRGTITGGDKDITPPKMIGSTPKNLSTNFDKNSIRINFDEYIKIKDLERNLIISPPMKTNPTITPQGSAAKYIQIKINDTLQPNTTYSFNFGQSITDNNEGNAYKNFKYVVSTGKTIDSLGLEGSIKDSYEKEIPHFVNVMLYEVDDKFNDSIIYKKTPRYITNTLDSLKTFKIENIKAGKYKLVALKEKNSNYKFDPKSDKIGFYNQIISIPDKSIYELELFKEELPLKFKKATQASGNRALIPFEGDSKNTQIIAKHNGQEIKTKLTKLSSKDSLQLWFQPIKNDSLELEIKNGAISEKQILKLRNQRNDTLKLNVTKNKVLNLKDNYSVEVSTPIEKIDASKIKLVKKDSTKVDFKTNYDELNQKLDFLFKKEPEEKYSLQILPGAIEDYLGKKNDTLKATFATKSISEYGNLKLNLQNVKSFPIIVELTDEKGNTLVSEYSDKSSTIEFLLIEPRKYSLRIIYDTNKNKKRDTGIYLKNIQPEEVIHFPTQIDVRENWDVNQDFDLKQ